DRVAETQVVLLELVVGAVRIRAQVVGLDFEAAQLVELVGGAGAVFLVIGVRVVLDVVIGGAQVQVAFRVFKADTLQVARRTRGLFAGRVGGQQLETIPGGAAVV